MEIVAYQIKDRNCSFIYKAKHGYQVVSAENNYGLEDFLHNYGGEKLNKFVNIHDHCTLLRLRSFNTLPEDKIKISFDINDISKDKDEDNG
jgi:hypothetical protein